MLCLPESELSNHTHDVEKGGAWLALGEAEQTGEIMLAICGSIIFVGFIIALFAIARYVDGFIDEAHRRYGR